VGGLRQEMILLRSIYVYGISAHTINIFPEFRYVGGSLISARDSENYGVWMIMPGSTL
jgi:hypothetical protein